MIAWLALAQESHASDLRLHKAVRGKIANIGPVRDSIPADHEPWSRVWLRVTSRMNQPLFFGSFGFLLVQSGNPDNASEASRNSASYESLTQPTLQNPNPNRESLSAQASLPRSYLSPVEFCINNIIASHLVTSFALDARNTLKSASKFKVSGRRNSSPALGRRALTND